MPISQRLLCCAHMVPQDARVADIGADHGYLGIYLLKKKLVRYVAACDLREGPLQSARRNAARHGCSDAMDFILSDGLHEIAPERVDTVVCAGMGGELIVKILSEAPWLRDPRYTLVLQPQNRIPTLRVWLSENGFQEEEAQLVQEGGFLYCAIRARFGTSEALTVGQQFVSPALLQSGSPLLGEYFSHIRTTIDGILAGLTRASGSPDAERFDYYRTAAQELAQMEEQYENCG